MESMVALTNLPNREVKSHPDGKPSKETFDAIFQEYQEGQIPRMQKITNVANLIACVQAWDSLWMKLMALWVVPVQSDRKLGQDPGDIIKGGVKLDFVPIREYKEKNVLWDGTQQPREETSRDKI